MYGELVVGVSGDPTRLEAVLNRMDARLFAMARTNYKVPVTLDTQMLGQSISKLKSLPNRIGKLVFQAEIVLKTDGTAILAAKNGLKGVENQSKNTSSQVTKTAADIRVLHKNLTELGSGTTNVKLNTKDLAAGLSRVRSNQLRYSREFDNTTSTGGILGEINKLESFFRGQGVKADAFNRIIPELKRVLELQQNIKASRKIDFVINVTGNNKAKIKDLTVTLDGADKRVAVLNKLLAELEGRGGKAMIPFIRGLASTEEQIRRAGIQLNQLKNASGAVKINNGLNGALASDAKVQQLNKLLGDLEARGGRAMIPFIRSLATVDEQIRRASVQLNQLKTASGAMKIGGGLAAAKAEQAKLNSQLKEFQGLLRGAERTGGFFLKPFIKNAQMLERQLLAVKNSGAAIDNAQYGAKMTAAIQRLNNEKSRADGLAGRLEKRYQGLAQVAGHVGNTIARWVFGYVVVSQLIRLMRELGEATVGFNDVLDKARLTFTAHFVGNRDLADDLIKRMQKLAAFTNFSFKELLPYTQKLMVAGRNAKTVIKDIQGIGDFVALKGQDSEMIGRITYALNQIKTAGKVMGTEVRQLTEALVPASQILADAWGVSTSKMQEWIKQGIVPADKAVKALIAGMSKMGDGFMEKQARTLMGAATNIQDAIQRLLGGAFRPLYDELTRNALVLNDFLNSPEAEKRASKWANVVTELINKAKTAWTVLNDLKGAILGVGVAFAGIKVGMGLMAIVTMLKDLQLLMAGGGLLAGLAPTLGPIVAFAANPYVLALLAGAMLVGGIALWSKFNRELERTRAITGAVQRGTIATGKAFSDMEKVVGSNTAAKKMLFGLQKQVETAHGDTTKLQKALVALSAAEVKIKDLGLDAGAKNVFLESIRELIREASKEKVRIEVEVDKGMTIGEKEADLIKRIKHAQAEAAKFGIKLPAAPERSGLFGAFQSFDLEKIEKDLDAAIEKIRAKRAKAGKTLPLFSDTFSKDAAAALRKTSNEPQYKVQRLLEGKGADNVAYLQKEYAKFEALIKKNGNYTGADKTALANLKNAINRLNAAKDKLVDTMYTESDLMQNKAKSQAAELNKIAATHERNAAAAEASAKRQIAALQSVAETVSNIFGGAQSQLLKAGIANSPIDKVLARLETRLGLQGKANVAVGEWNKSQQLRTAAENAREQANNLTDTSPEITDIGMKIANAAVKMQSQASKFKNQCDALADKTVLGVTTIYNAFMGKGKGRASAAQTMAGFQKAGIGFAANGSYAPGDIVYSGKKFGKGSGHVMIVGPDGKFYDQYTAGRGAKASTPTTTPEWVVRPGAASSVGQFKRGPLGGKAGVIGALFGEESPLAGVDLGLNKFASLPKEFGKPIKETADNAYRFALQMALADKKTQNLLRTILGADFGAFVKEAKIGANEADFFTNGVMRADAALKAFQGRQRELGARARSRGKEGDPFFAIEEARRKGGDLYGASNAQIQKLQNQILRVSLNDLTFSIRQSNKALADKSKILEAGRKFITQSGVDEYAYAKAIERRGREVEFWNRADVIAMYKRGKALEDFGKKTKAGLEELRKMALAAADDPLLKLMGLAPSKDDIAKTILQQFDAAQAAFKKAKGISTNLNKDFQTYLAGGDSDYEGGKATERSLAISRTRGELNLQKSVLSETVKLTQNWTGSEMGLTDAIAKKETVLRKIKEFLDQGYGAQSESLANEVAWRESVNRGLERTKALLDEIRQSGKESAMALKDAMDARELMVKFQDNPDLADFETRKAEKLNELLQRMKDDPKFTGAAMRELLGNWEQIAKAGLENGRIQAALGTANQMELDISLRRLGLERALTEEKKLQLQFDKQGPALTKEEAAARERQLKAARENYSLGISEYRKSQYDQTALSRLFGGAKLDEQFKQMGKGMGWSDETINALLPIDRIERRAKDLFEGLQGLMSDWQGTWSGMWQDVAKTANFSLGTMLNNLTDRLVSWSAQVLADETWNQVMGLLSSFLPIGKVASGTKGVGPVANGDAYAGMVNAAKTVSLPSVNTAQIAKEITRGAALQSVSAARSGGGSGDVYFTGPVNFPGVRDMANVKSAVDQKVGTNQSRRSNMKTAQNVVTNGA